MPAPTKIHTEVNAQNQQGENRKIYIQKLVKYVCQILLYLTNKLINYDEADYHINYFIEYGCNIEYFIEYYHLYTSR